MCIFIKTNASGRVALFNQIRVSFKYHHQGTTSSDGLYQPWHQQQLPGGSKPKLKGNKCQLEILELSRMCIFIRTKMPRALFNQIRAAFKSHQLATTSSSGRLNKPWHQKNNSNCQVASTSYKLASLEATLVQNSAHPPTSEPLTTTSVQSEELLHNVVKKINQSLFQ